MYFRRRPLIKNTDRLNKAVLVHQLLPLAKHFLDLIFLFLNHLFRVLFKNQFFLRVKLGLAGLSRKCEKDSTRCVSSQSRVLINIYYLLTCNARLLVERFPR